VEGCRLPAVYRTGERFTFSEHDSAPFPPADRQSRLSADFRSFLEQFNAKSILTEAIRNLLTEFNLSRRATQSQLIFGLSSLFLYIQAFAVAKEVDGQAICEYLLSRPFLSPFCLLAIANHISQQLYLFNLVVPRQFTLDSPTNEEALSIVQEQFPAVDFGIAQENVDLSPVLSALPQILVNYFLSKQSSNEEIHEFTSDAAYIVNFHLCGASIYDQMRKLYATAQETLISPLVVSSLGCCLLTSLMSLLSRMFRERDRSAPLTPELCQLYAIVSSMILRTSNDQSISKLFDASAQPFAIERLLRAIVCHCQFPLHSRNAQRLILPYCFESYATSDLSAVLARFLIAKILTVVPVQLSNHILAGLAKCQDVGIMLDFMWFSRTTSVHISSDLVRLKSFQNDLIARLPFRFCVMAIVGIDDRKAQKANGTCAEVLDILNSSS
jgi:hypothetical protein